MNVYAVTMTLEFSVVASSRKQAEKFARESIEERCVTLEDAEMTIAKMQFVAGSPSAHNDGPLLCENCGKPMAEHDDMAHCWVRALPGDHSDGSSCDS